MPHYKDGTEAKVGDLAKGKPYNTPHEVCGVVTGITPDSEACNLRITFAQPYEADRYATSHVAAIFDTAGKDPALVTLKTDYGETADFDLVHRPEAEK